MQDAGSKSQGAGGKKMGGRIARTLIPTVCLRPSAVGTVRGRRRRRLRPRALRPPVLPWAGVLILALALRLWGIGFGYPYDYHFDEPTYVRIALDMGRGIVGRQPNPTGFPNILLGEYAACAAFGRVSALVTEALGSRPSVHPAPMLGGEQAWPLHPSFFLVLLARLTSGFAGTLNVLAVYRLGRAAARPVDRRHLAGMTSAAARPMDRRHPAGMTSADAADVDRGRSGTRSGPMSAASLAALFLAVSFLHVRDSHYATPDVLAACLASFSVTCAALALRRRRGRWSGVRRRFLYVAGACAGYAIATKWTVWPVLVPLAVAATARAWNDGHGLPSGGSGSRSRDFPIASWALLIGSLLGGVLVGGFQLALKPGLYLDYARYELEAGRAGGFWIWHVDTVPGWLFYLKTLNYGLGTVLLGLALVGLVRRAVMAVRCRDRMSVVLLSFPLLYFLPMSLTRHYFARYALPLVPFCALFGAETVVAIAAWAGSRGVKRGWSPRVAIWGLVVLTLAAVVQPLAWSVRHDVTLAREDTRNLAKRWIEANIPAGAKIAMDWPVYGPPLSREFYEVDEVGGVGLSARSLDWYRDNGFGFIVTSSFVTNLLLIDGDMDATRQAFHAALEREPGLVRVFWPGKDGVEPSFVFGEIYGPVVSLWERERPGPVIEIYSIEQSDLE